MPSENHIESVTQIPGVLVGHSTNAEAGTGCTVIVCPSGATGGVDVRGGAPATRETDLLRPEETVEVLHAVVLSGGSAYGLSASCGVAEELERRGLGLDVGVAKVPIVSAACRFSFCAGRCRPMPGMTVRFSFNSPHPIRNTAVRHLPPAQNLPQQKNAAQASPAPHAPSSPSAEKEPSMESHPDSTGRPSSPRPVFSPSTECKEESCHDP